MRFYLYTLLAAGLALGGLTSCNNEEIKMDPVATRAASALTGRVLLTDEFQSDPMASPDVEVKIFKYQSDEEVTGAVRTDASGNYRFENVQPGVYKLTYSAAGYPSVTRVRVDHGGGVVTSVPLTYLSAPSTTQVTELRLDTLLVRRVTQFRRDRELAAGESYPLLAGVLYYFYETGADQVVRRLSRTPATDSVFNFPIRTTINIPDSLIVNERNLRVFARISPNNDSANFQDRGLVLMMSDASNVSSANAKLVLRANPHFNRDTVHIDLPLTDLQDAGILRLPGNAAPGSENVTLFARAFGYSGRRTWYGATIDEASGNAVLPTLNPVSSVELAQILPSKL